MKGRIIWNSGVAHGEKVEGEGEKKRIKRVRPVEAIYITCEDACAEECKHIWFLWR